MVLPSPEGAKCNLTLRNFLRRCGLDLTRPEQAAIYHQMQEETSEGLRRMQLEQAGAPPPRRYQDLSEAAVQEQIAEIYATAHPETRQIYDLGRGEGTGQNWIIRSMLALSFERAAAA